MYLIVECSEADQWPTLYAARLDGPGAPRRIPEGRKPQVLQPTREIAEREALRLAQRYPGSRFVVFAAVAAGITTKVASHQTVSGKVYAERDVAALVTISDPDEEIPF